MVFNVFTKIKAPIRLNAVKILPKYYSMYEPNYLELYKNKFPVYPSLLVKIKGYDFPILESYQSWVNKITKVMKINVIESYAMPSKDLKVVRLKKHSKDVEVEYLLKIYERNLHIDNVTAVILPLYYRFLEAGLPEGVELYIDKFKEEDRDNRYLVDQELIKLKDQVKKPTRE